MFGCLVAWLLGWLFVCIDSRLFHTIDRFCTLYTRRLLGQLVPFCYYIIYTFLYAEALHFDTISLSVFFQSLPIVHAA